MGEQQTTQYERDLVKADKCPRCRGALDTGWECADCGYDAMPIAHLDCPKCGKSLVPAGDGSDTHNCVCPEPRRSFPDASMLILNGEPTYDQWITELERIAGEWDAKHGNLPYTLPLRDSTGVGCWHDFFEDGLMPQEAFDSDQSHWES